MRPVRSGPSGTEIGNVWAVAEDADGTLVARHHDRAVSRPERGVGQGRRPAPAGQRFSVATGHLRDDWVMALVGARPACGPARYNGGVTRFELVAPTRRSRDAARRRLDQPGRPALDGDRLMASTMEGLRIGDGHSATWIDGAGLPGKDVTAVARVGSTLVVATRRGLVESAAAPAAAR